MRSRRIGARGLTLLLLAGLACGTFAPDAWGARRRKGADDGKEDYKAHDMLSKGLELIAEKQDERGVKLIASIPRMFPQSKVRFMAHMELGKHFQKKHQYDLATKQFMPVEAAEEEELRAEALYRTGICYYNLDSFDKAFMTLRKVTNEFPWSVYANESFYYIGLCHFKLRRWTKAVEALHMVGTSVPSNVGGQVFGEAGQRFYVKILDQDLVVLKETGEELAVEVVAASGDREKLVLEQLGHSGEYYLGSLPTQPGQPTAGDGMVQVMGGDVVSVQFTDENTESGERNRTILTEVRMVSTATGGFTDGAYREYTHGVFGDGDVFVRVKDLDRDTSHGPDTVKCRLSIQYKVKKERDESLEGIDLSEDEEEEEETVTRDSIVATLTETGEHTGVFVGSAKTVVAGEGTTVDRGDQTLSAAQDDSIVLEYDDEMHIRGELPRTVRAEARMLVGAIQDVKIEHREVQSLEVKAKKELIEAKIFLKLGSIFKEVGLDAEAYEKADEGLERVEAVIRTSMKASLDRAIVEEAFSVKWELLLVQDKLSEAIAVCHSLTRLFPDSTLVDKALLKIGLAKMNSENPRAVDEAVSIFNSIFRIQRSSLKAEASFRIAEVYERRAIMSAGKDREPDLSHAMLAFKRCAEEYPESAFAGEALDKIINFYVNNKDYKRAVDLMARVFQDYPDASFLDKILLKWGIAAYRMRDYTTARDKLSQLVAEYPSSPVASKAKKSLELIEKKLQ